MFWSAAGATSIRGDRSRHNLQAASGVEKMMTRWQNRLLMLSAALLAGCADEAADDQQQKPVAAVQPPFAAEDAKMPADGAWITVTGTVVSSLPRFVRPRVRGSQCQGGA